MLPHTLAQSALNHSDLTPKILESRDQYRSCHVCLPGEDYRVAAVAVDDQYYSLVKVVKDYPRSLEIAGRLTATGKKAVITKLAKGYAIWRLEPDAYTDSCPRSPSRSLTQPIGLPIKILESSSEYKLCHIRISDLDQRLAAVIVDGSYYGLFKIVTTQQQALLLAGKLQRKDERVVITKTSQGYALWVLEPDAIICEN